MALSTQQQLLVEQRLQNDKKSAGVAYLLWFFLGCLGGHRFYLGRTGSALAMLLLFVFGWILAVVVVGFVMIAAVALWALVDAFLIPGMIEADTASKRSRISNEVGLMTAG